MPKNFAPEFSPPRVPLANASLNCSNPNFEITALAASSFRRQNIPRSLCMATVERSASAFRPDGRAGMHS